MGGQAVRRSSRVAARGPRGGGSGHGQRRDVQGVRAARARSPRWRRHRRRRARCWWQRQHQHRGYRSTRQQWRGRRSRRGHPGARERAVIFGGGLGFFLISLGSPRALRAHMGVQCTCGEPNEIELIAADGFFNASVQARVSQPQRRFGARVQHAHGPRTRTQRPGPYCNHHTVFFYAVASTKGGAPKRQRVCVLISSTHLPSPTALMGRNGS